MRTSHLFILAIICLCGMISCSEDTEVGSGLLSSEDLSIEEISDFDIKVRHMAPGSIPQTLSTFVPRHSLGTLDSRTYGSMAASFYARPILTLSPVFENGTFDSVALTLRIDTSRTYGNPNAQHNLKVFLLEESLDDLDTIRSDQDFMVAAEPLGELNRLTPDQLDTTVILDFRADSTFVNDLIVIPLDQEFGQMIFDDTENHGDINGFLDLVKGFYVTSESNNTLIQLDLSDANSALMFFYKDSLGTSRNFPYQFSSLAPLHFDYDISGSEMEMAFGDSSNQSLFYLQGHAGTILEVDISDILREKDRFINLVTLEFFASPTSNVDTSLFELPGGLDILVMDEDNNLVPILDLAIAQVSGQATSIFDGDREVIEGDNIIKYKMNLTNYIKSLFDGEVDQTKIYLTVRNRVQNPNNVILFGPDHPTYPVKLNLTYTKS